MQKKYDFSKNDIIYKVIRRQNKDRKPLVSQYKVKRVFSPFIFVYGKLFPLVLKNIAKNPNDLSFKNEKKSKFEKNEKIPFLIFIGIILFSFSAPLLFTRPAFLSIFDFSDTGAIGDTINGLMGPFIAIAAALLTFFAFKEQIKANLLQKEATDNQIKKDNEDSFENRLFKLIEMHKQNVNDLLQLNPEAHSGQEVVAELCIYIDTLIRIIMYFQKSHEKIFSPKEMRIFAFLYICHGDALVENKAFLQSANFSRYANEAILKMIES